MTGMCHYIQFLSIEIVSWELSSQAGLKLPSPNLYSWEARIMAWATTPGKDNIFGVEKFSLSKFYEEVSNKWCFLFFLRLWGSNPGPCIS
jgi:hypothetical protein